MQSQSMRRADPPRPPAETPESARAARVRREAVAGRERKESGRIARGLLWLGVVVVLLSILHAGFGRAFVPGWWRQW